MLYEQGYTLPISRATVGRGKNRTNEKIILDSEDNKMDILKSKIRYKKI